MAAKFSYKEATSKTMKVAGIIDTDDMTISLDREGDKKLSTLFKEYNGCEVTISIVCKDEIDLDEPIEDDEE